jgi:hypothetical protein
MQDQWKSVEQALQPLLREFADGDASVRWQLLAVLPESVRECSAASTDTSQLYLMRSYELLFVLRVLKHHVVSSLTEVRTVLEKHSSQDMQVLTELDAAMAAVEHSINTLLDMPKHHSKRPALSLLKEIYDLSPRECALIALIAVGDETRVSLLAHFVSDRYAQNLKVDKLMALDMTGMNGREFDRFCSDETSIIKDGMVVVNNSMRGSGVLSLKPEFCRLLVGLSLSSTAKDKLRHAIFFPQFRLLLRGNLNYESADAGSEVVEHRQQPDNVQVVHGAQSSMPEIKEAKFTSQVHEPTAALVKSPLQLGSTATQAHSNQDSVLCVSDDTLTPKSPSCSDDGFLPYSDDAEFMEDKFEQVALIMRIANQRLEDDINKSSDKGVQNRYFGPHFPSGGSSASFTKTAQNELHALNVRIQLRLKLMIERGMKLPQLERVKEQIGLNDFEERVLLYLAGKAIASVKFAQFANNHRQTQLSLNSSRSQAGSVFVGELLELFSANFREGIENRKCFGKSGKLVKNGFIVVNSSAFSAYSKELRNCEVVSSSAASLKSDNSAGVNGQEED